MSRINTDPGVLSATIARAANQLQPATSASAAGSFVQLLKDSGQAAQAGKPKLPIAAPAPAAPPQAAAAAPGPTTQAPKPESASSAQANAKEPDAPDAQGRAQNPGSQPAATSAKAGSKGAASTPPKPSERSAAVSTTKPDTKPTGKPGDASDVTEAAVTALDAATPQDAQLTTGSEPDQAQGQAPAQAIDPTILAALAQHQAQHEDGSRSGASTEAAERALGSALAGTTQPATQALQGREASSNAPLTIAADAPTRAVAGMGTPSARSERPLGEQVLAVLNGQSGAASVSLAEARGNFAASLQAAQQLRNDATPASTSSLASPLDIQAPLYSADFAPEVGARLSLAAADGVQQAELHLNPAEMGPVQVQIVMDGQQAQISFVAEQADTRAALERGLPDLAAALRDNGMTLSGGGVFSQSQGQRQASEAQAGPRRAENDGANAPLESAAISRPTSGRVTRGVLDLFA